MSMTLSYLKGQGKLWKAFWFFMVLIPLVLFILPLLLVPTLFKPPFTSSLGHLLTIILFLEGISVIYGVLATWQCAPNSSKRLWMWLARIFVILFVIANLRSSWSIDNNKQVSLLNVFNYCFIIFVVIWFALKCNMKGVIYKFFIPVSLVLGTICFLLFTMYVIVTPSSFYYGFGHVKTPNYSQQRAEASNAEAAYKLAQTYEHGTNGYKQSYQEAVKWYKVAADRGSIFAKTNLAGLYSSGKGTPKDLVAANKLYQEAAIEGDMVAVYNLGLNYELGLGVKQDYHEAGKFYLLAAQHADGGCAQNDLGMLYASGKGVAQNDAQAIYWFKKAAASGLQEMAAEPYISSLTDKDGYIDAYAQYRLDIVRNNKASVDKLNPAFLNAAKSMGQHYEDECRK